MAVAWLLVATAMSVGAHAGPVAKTPASPPAPTPRPPTPALTAAERTCLDDLKLLYPGDGRCYQLLSTGPCKSHEWLVLDPRSPDRLRSVCARVPCAEREVLWRDGRCYQRYRDRDLLCPHARNLLVPNPFGLGECSCMRTPPHARDAAAAGAEGECYPLYHRGPCAEGEVLLPKANATADQGVCSRDPCLRQQQQQQQQQQQGGGQEEAPAPVMPMVLWPREAGGDGKCHRLGAMDVCPESASFGIHPHTLRPGCIVRINHLLPPTPCSGDRCSPTNTAAYSEGYIKELFQAHKSHKNLRRTG